MHGLWCGACFDLTNQISSKRSTRLPHEGRPSGPKGRHLVELFARVAPEVGTVAILLSVSDTGPLSRRGALRNAAIGQRPFLIYKPCGGEQLSLSKGYNVTSFLSRSTDCDNDNSPKTPKARQRWRSPPRDLVPSPTLTTLGFPARQAKGKNVYKRSIPRRMPARGCGDEREA